MTVESDCLSGPTVRSLETALAQWSTPACLVDGEGRVVAGSKGFADLTNTELEALKGVDPQLLIESIGDGTAATWMAEIVDAAGSRSDLLVVEAGEGHLAASGRTVFSPGLSLDRLAAIGEVAPPLFHDLNNMLGSISGITELAAMKLPDDDPMKARLGRVVDSVIRASALGRQISLLVRTPPESPPKAELIDLFDEAMVLARSFLNRGITIETRWPEHRLATDLHPSSLRHLAVEIILAAGVVLQDQEGTLTWTIAKGERENTGRPTALLTVKAAPVRDTEDPTENPDSVSRAFTPGFFRKIATIASLANSFGGHVSPVRLEEESGFSLTVTLPVSENTAL